MDLQENRHTKTNILIVEDHPIVRRGLIHLLNSQPDFCVCGEAETARKAMAAIGDLKPDLVIIDISLPGADGIELTKNIIAQWPETLILIQSMHEETLYVDRALRAGAKGYLMKQEATENLIGAIRQILDGKIYVSQKMANHLMHQAISAKTMKETASPVAILSDRELEVFQQIGLGRGTRQIAGEMNLSVKTVESHRAHIKEKMNLRTAPEMVCFAVQWVSQGTL